MSRPLKWRLELVESGISRWIIGLQLWACVCLNVGIERRPGCVYLRKAQPPRPPFLSFFSPSPPSIAPLLHSNQSDKGYPPRSPPATAPLQQQIRQSPRLSAAGFIFLGGTSGNGRGRRTKSQMDKRTVTERQMWSAAAKKHKLLIFFHITSSKENTADTRWHAHTHGWSKLAYALELAYFQTWSTVLTSGGECLWQIGVCWWIGAWILCAAMLGVMSRLP